MPLFFYFYKLYRNVIHGRLSEPLDGQHTRKHERIQTFVDYRRDQRSVEMSRKVSCRSAKLLRNATSACSTDIDLWLPTVRCSVLNDAK